LKTKGRVSLKEIVFILRVHEVFTSDSVLAEDEWKAVASVLLARYPNESRRTTKICEAWQWRQANGTLRDMVCRGLMLMLDRAGQIELPPVSYVRHNPLANRARRCINVPAFAPRTPWAAPTFHRVAADIVHAARIAVPVSTKQPNDEFGGQPVGVSLFAMKTLL
jgi:hypothetical protein